MNDIEIFLSKQNHAQKSNKISVLEPFKDEIFQLKNMGYTEKIIVAFLAEMKGVKISRQALNQFIRSRTQNEQSENMTTQKLPQNQQPPKTQAVANNEVQPNSKKKIKKFDWQNASTDGLI